MCCALMASAISCISHPFLILRPGFTARGMETPCLHGGHATEVAEPNSMRGVSGISADSSIDKCIVVSYAPSSTVGNAHDQASVGRGLLSVSNQGPLLLPYDELDLARRHADELLRNTAGGHPGRRSTEPHVHV